MTMRESLRQVRSAICVNWREIAPTRSEAIGGADHSNSLTAIIVRRGHLAIKMGRKGGLCDKMCTARSSPLVTLGSVRMNCWLYATKQRSLWTTLVYIIKSAGSPEKLQCGNGSQVQLDGMVLQLS
jgi:hypothetical protein